MGSCYTQKPKIDEDVKQFQSMHATTSPKPEKPHNDSMVEGNRDAYFSAEEQKYYHEHCNSFDLASVQPEKHSQISYSISWIKDGPILSRFSARDHLGSCTWASIQPLASYWR
jgi:hypothetical protein